MTVPMGSMTPELKARLKALLRRLPREDIAAWIGFLTDFGVEMCKQGYDHRQTEQETP